MAGETRWVRPLKPCRPSKLRFEVEAQRSPGLSLSGFIARHIEQPGSRQSKPATTKILSSPSASACAFTRPDPGTMRFFRCPHAQAGTPQPVKRLRTVHFVHDVPVDIEQTGTVSLRIDDVLVPYQVVECRVCHS